MQIFVLEEDNEPTVLMQVTAPRMVPAAVIGVASRGIGPMHVPMFDRLNTAFIAAFIPEGCSSACDLYSAVCVSEGQRLCRYCMPMCSIEDASWCVLCSKAGYY